MAQRWSYSRLNLTTSTLTSLNSPPTTWRTLAHQYYFEVFDPLLMSEPGAGDLDDDMSDVYADVARGLIAYDVRGTRDVDERLQRRAHA